MDSKKEPSLWPVAILGMLVSAFAFLKSKSNQPSRTIHVQNSATEKRGNFPNELPKVPQPTVPPQHNDGSNESKKHTPFWENATAWATLGLLVVNIFQSRSTEKAAIAARDSADLTERTLEGTQAAVVRINDIAGSGGYWQVNAYNFGKVISPKLDVKCSLIHQTFPSQQVIGPVEDCSFSHVQIRPTTEREGPDVVYGFRTPGYDEKSAELVNVHETFIIRGTWAYDNGFRHWCSESFCWQTYPVPGNPTKINWQSCDVAQASLHQRLLNEK